MLVDLRSPNQNRPLASSCQYQQAGISLSTGVRESREEAKHSTKAPWRIIYIPQYVQIWERASTRPYTYSLRLLLSFGKCLLEREQHLHRKGQVSGLTGSFSHFALSEWICQLEGVATSHRSRRSVRSSCSFTGIASGPSSTLAI